MAQTVLLVEDEVKIRELLRGYLERAGLDVVTTGCGAEAITLAARAEPDLVILDLRLPDVPGEEVAREVRRRGSMPILMLTAKSSQLDRISGLEIGADDYVTKPFSPRELALRVSSVLRRTGAAPASGELVDRDVRLDVAARRATRGGTELSLTTREFDLLVFFLSHPGEVFTREQLLEKVWGWDFGDQSTVTVHVRRLREKIEKTPAKPSRIATVWGVGYRYDRA